MPFQPGLAAADSLTTVWLDPLTEPRWPELVDRHSLGSVFHSRGWLEALRRTYGYEPTAVASQTTAGTLAAGLVFCRIDSSVTGRRLVSLPFSDHCDPLVQTDQELRALIDGAIEARDRDRLRYLEWRPTFDAGPGAASLRPDGYCLHRLDLSVGEDALARGFHRNHVMRKIRRSQRERLLYVEGATPPLLDAFYHLLIQTRRRHGMPPQPRRWFQNILECLPGVASIRVAYAGERPVAAILTLAGRNTMIFKYGASDARFHPLGGMQMLVWRAIQDATARGCRAFDFGRSDNGNLGLIAFKEHWGAIRTPLNYCYHPARRASGVVHRTGRLLARGVARFAPDWLLVASGDAVYPHLG